MTQTRYLTVSDLIKELYELKAPGARVNVTVVTEQNTDKGKQELTFNGPAERVERIFIQGEGPAVRIIAQHGELL